MNSKFSKFSILTYLAQLPIFRLYLLVSSLSNGKLLSDFYKPKMVASLNSNSRANLAQAHLLVILS